MKIIPIIIFLFILFIYTLTLAPGITARDSGEFITAIKTLGIPHPSGAPLYVILGKVFAYFPFGSFPERVNFMSAFFGALSIVMVYLIYRISFPKRIEGAILSSLIFGMSLSFWMNTTRAEVYTLKIFLLLSSFYFLLSKNGKRKKFSLLFLGLAASVHTASLILFPLYLYPFKKEDLIRFLKSIPYFFIGLLPYIYLPLRSIFHPVLSWGNPHTLRGFYKYLSASRYGQELFKISPYLFLVHIKEFFIHLRSEYFPPLLLFAFIGFLYFIKSREKEKYFFFSLFFIDLSFFSSLPSVISHMYLLSYLVVAIWIGYGIEKVVKSKKTFLILLSLLLFSLFSYSYRMENRSKDRTMYLYGKEILSSLPKNSILINGPLDTIFTFWYLEWAENFRADVIQANFNTFYQPYFLNQLKSRNPELNLPDLEKFFAMTDNPQILSKLTMEKFVKINKKTPIFFNFYPYPFSSEISLYNKGVLYTTDKDFPFLLTQDKFLEKIGWNRRNYIDEEERAIISQIFFYKAMYNLEKEEEEKVKGNLIETINIYQKHHLALYFLGRVLKENKEEKIANFFFMSSIKAEPSYLPSYIEILKFFSSKRKWKKLRRYAVLSLHIFPKNYLPYLYLGLCEVHSSNYRKAESLFSKGLKLKPDYLPLLYNFALVKLHFREKEEAREIISRGLKISPKNSHFLYLLRILNNSP